MSELLSPAGDFDTALSAFAAGADAVYCGLADFSARAFAKNFTFEELELLMAYARKNGKRVYVTFNTLLDEDALEGAVETLAKLEEIGPSALIVQDLGVARLVRRHFPALSLHASTQLVAHNLEGVLALRELGFSRVVLARELSLAEIESIAKRCGETELEVFIHGALCYSISGLCLFGAMEKGRSGNRGKCPYCCRQNFDGAYPFSMKDLRLGVDVKKLVDAGVASLKIEGRMKSPLYVASVTKYYRSILDGTKGPSLADLETVFSRRTTELYLNGRKESPIDSESLGHVGTPIGKVKKITKDRDGNAWLRFHTLRALEKHDGLQFDAMNDEGRHVGIGITEMRQAISRRNVFEVAAGEDVEILVPEDLPIRTGDEIYCSMSNAVKREFPLPSFRPSDYEGGMTIDIAVALRKDGVECRAVSGELLATVRREVALEVAKTPEKTLDGVRKAFSKLGGTRYLLEKVELDDPEQRFVPMSVLNDLRRDVVDALDKQVEKRRQSKIDAALDEMSELDNSVGGERMIRKTIKLNSDQKLPASKWDEVIIVMEKGGDRVATPIYTAEPEFGDLRRRVKALIREGCDKWEASDLATLRMLRELGIKDITADWTLYAFNSQALKQLAELGVRRFVASPENNRENLQYLAESGYDVEFLTQQSTPLFISLTQPAGDAKGLAVQERDGLYVTTKLEPRTFDVPEGVSTRVDLSWEPNDDR